MHNRFESLLQRCRARRRKRLLMRLAVLALLAGAVAAGVLLGRPDGSLSDIVQRAPQAYRVANVEVRKEGAEGKPRPPERSVSPAVQRPLAEEPPAAEPQRAAKPTPPPQPEPVHEPTVSDAPAPADTKGERKRADAAPKEEPRTPPSAAARGEGGEESQTEILLEVKDVTSLDALLEQYGNAPRYAVALKIAESYYRDGDFENASYWARKANLLDRDDERAWIIYAESEYALGHEKRAIRILRLFLDYKDSAKARSLLMTWSRP